MNDIVIVAIIGLLAAPLAALIGWLVNRKKNVADITNALMESSHHAVETMQTTMETLHDELQKAHIKIDALIEENIRMQDEIKELRHQNSLLLDENHVLHAKIDDLVAKISAEQ